MIVIVHRASRRSRIRGPRSRQVSSKILLSQVLLIHHPSSINSPSLIPSSFRCNSPRTSSRIPNRRRDSAEPIPRNEASLVFRWAALKRLSSSHVSQPRPGCHEAEPHDRDRGSLIVLESFFKELLRSTSIYESLMPAMALNFAKPRSF